MKFYVVRHCSTVRSEQKIFCGSTDIPLSPRGEEEAERLSALRLSPDVIFSSPLLRARQTAEAIAGGHIPVLLDARLRRNMGLKYPNGESYLDVAARIYPFLGKIGARFAGKTVCLVSHGSACRVIRAYFKEMTDGEFYAYSQPNGSVEEYEL